MKFICVNKVDMSNKKDVLNKKACSAANLTAAHLIMKKYNLKVKPVPLGNTGFMEEIKQ